MPCRRLPVTDNRRVGAVAMPPMLADRLWADADAEPIAELARRIARDIARHRAGVGEAADESSSSSTAVRMTGEERHAVREPLRALPELVPAPPSSHRLDAPHQVTPEPQPMFAQRAFVGVENIGSVVAYVRKCVADATSVGTVTVRPPAAIAPGTTRPVELAVSTLSRAISVPAGQIFRFMLEYDGGEAPRRQMWAMVRYLSGGGWENLSHETRDVGE